MYNHKTALPQDIATIVSLADRTWKQTYRGVISDEQIEYMYGQMYTPEALLAQQENGHTFIIALENNEPMGFASFSNTEPSVYKIHKLYVLPETQGKGCGRFLVDTVAEEVKKLGATILELNVNRFNKAKHFYDKIGFSIYKEIDIPYGDFVLNDYVMRREI